MSEPQRIQLRRSRGWRMPPNTVKVDRSTRWGNPFIVGAQGNAAECVYQFGMLVCGYTCISVSENCVERQRALFRLLVKQKRDGYPDLRGKNLACWCKVGEPCHGDLLLWMANKPPRQRLDLQGFLARYGWRIENGEAVRIAA